MVISRILFPGIDQGGDHSSGMPIARHLMQPTRKPRAGHSQTLPYLVLLRVGFTKPVVSPPQLVSSYLTFSPLPEIPGGIFSVALSLESPPVCVTDHSALWSPDFPLDRTSVQRSPAISSGTIFFTSYLPLMHISDVDMKDK